VGGWMSECVGEKVSGWMSEGRGVSGWVDG